MKPAELIFVVCVVAFTLVAAVTDARTKKLPNVLTVPAFVLGLLYHVVSGWLGGGWIGLLGAWQTDGLVFSLAGFATGFGILLVLWLIGGGGGGDVKFMGALGAWLGIRDTVLVFLVGTVFAVLGSVGLFAAEFLRTGYSGMRRRYLTPAAAPRKAAASAGPKAPRRLMAFGVPVALATWVVLVLQCVAGRS